ncbi:MAG: chromosomal replication initiator protein DnaA, partial [Rhodospirillales bacterium]|nr:chromosomal replication initiator protein DnaA [Rhodospirillales bacterium]
MTNEVIGDLHEENWRQVCESLRSEIGEAAYQSWVKPMIIRGVADGAARVSVPTRFMRDWVVAHYVERLGAIWNAIDAAIDCVDISIQPERSLKASGEDSKTPSPAITAAAAATTAAVGMAQSDVRRASDIGQVGINGPLDTRFTFDNFVVGKPNEFAYAAARRVAEAASVPFNPLFLYGGVGLGKTHLMHAIAHHICQQDPKRTVIYLSAEKFMYRFIRALKEQNTVDFKDMFRNVDVLMIDDVQFIGGKGATQEEFFHTFNALVDQGRQIVISADKSPSDLEGMEERLQSRLNCGLVADIHATTYELRLGILQSKAEQLKVDVPQKMMEFLAHKITSNVRELEGALNRVVAHAQLVGREITLETAQEVLHDLLRANDRRVTIEEIQKQVASHFNIRGSDMHSARRARSVAR